MNGDVGSVIGGTAKARHEVVHEQTAPILSMLSRVTQSVRRDPPKDAQGNEDRSMAFAAASLSALVMEAGSEAWDDPLGEGEAENMLFAEMGDPAPSSYDYEMIPVAAGGSRLEGVGERQQRYNVGLKRIHVIMEAVLSDVPAFRTALRVCLDRIAARSPVRSIEEARRRIAVRMPSGQVANLDTHGFGVSQPAPLVASPKLTKLEQRRVERERIRSANQNPVESAPRRRPPTLVMGGAVAKPTDSEQMNLFA